MPQEDRVRGMMLGLLLGDAYDELDAEPGLARGTCLAQLACFTLEGLIRASVRMNHKGICHPPSIVWHAWCRWAHLQGLGDSFARRWGRAYGAWPDGWLSQVAPLAQRRGSAPATVAALRRSPEVPERPMGDSAGHHALTRTLPLAIFGHVVDLSVLGPDLVRLTHGNADAALQTAEALHRLAGLLAGCEVDWTSPAGGPRGTAGHAYREGVFAAARADSVREAIIAASSHGRGAATVAGAFAGARWGASALSPFELSVLEIGWVADRLARDAYLEVIGSPGGSEYSQGEDPTWWSRYPGW